jgi:hypothetical protein
LSKLAFCLPQADQVEADYCNCLASCVMDLMGASSPITSLGVIARRGSIIAAVRNDIVQEGLDTGVDHFLFIDDDHTFPADTARRLLGHKVPFVGINATTRGGPIRFTAWKAPGQMLISGPEHTGLVPVWRMGMGIALVARHVFEELPEPWFAVPWVRGPHGEFFQGEDIYFCEHAREAGFTPHVDQDLTVMTEHLAISSRTHDDVDMDALSAHYSVDLKTGIPLARPNEGLTVGESSPPSTTG